MFLSIILLNLRKIERIIKLNIKMMKHFYLFVISIIIGVTGFAQTATNFTCNDCSGGSHDLFTELDAGKVIVLCWVMPCSTCIPNSKTSYNVVNSYQTTYPNRVFFYMVDDYANTTCTSLNSWANTNGMPEASFSLRFSNASISISDYGAYAMPKIVVLGANTHTVFFDNSVTTFNAANLQTAINNALTATGVNEPGSDFYNISLYPVPSNGQTTLSLGLKSISEIKIELYNVVGKKVSEIYNHQLNSGYNEIRINTSDLTNGIYFIKIGVADRNKILKLIVSN